MTKYLGIDIDRWDGSEEGQGACQIGTCLLTYLQSYPKQLAVYISTEIPALVKTATNILQQLFCIQCTLYHI